MQQNVGRCAVKLKKNLLQKTVAAYLKRPSPKWNTGDELWLVVSFLLSRTLIHSGFGITKLLHLLPLEYGTAAHIRGAVSWNRTWPDVNVIVHWWHLCKSLCSNSDIMLRSAKIQHIGYRVGLVRAPCSRCSVVLPQEAPSSASRFHTRAHQFTVASALEMHAGRKLRCHSANTGVFHK